MSEVKCPKCEAKDYAIEEAIFQLYGLMEHTAQAPKRHRSFLDVHLEMAMEALKMVRGSEHLGENIGDELKMYLALQQLQLLAKVIRAQLDPERCGAFDKNDWAHLLRSTEAAMRVAQP